MFGNLSVILFWICSFAKILGAINYDEDLARWLVHFSAAVYCIDDEAIGSAYESLIFDWECDSCEYIRDNGNIASVYAFQDSSIFLDTEGLITYDDENNKITVVFAGTDPTEIVDVVTDLDLIRTGYPSCEADWWKVWEDDCTVHSGFYKSYKAVRSQVRSHVSDLLDDYPSATLEVTGHSLGGALAILCALDLAEQGMMPDYVYTFGQPRVGDDEFVEYYDSVVVDRTIRVTHRKDPVPLVPWTGWPWNYLHMGTEVYYPDDPDGSYQTCDGSGEDDDCINQHNWWEVLTNIFIIADHLYYLDVDFLSGVVECNIGFDLNGNGGDCAGNCTNFTSSFDNSTTVRNETIYEYKDTLDVLLNWTHYGSVLWDSDDMNDGGIGEQWLIKWSLIEAAVSVNTYLADDGDIEVVILNSTQFDNNTILVSMTVGFEFDHQFNQFYCNLSYVIDYFNDNFKDLLGVDDTIEEALLHHYNEINNVDGNCVPATTMIDDEEENESSSSGGDDGAVVRTLIIVAIGVFVFLIIGSFYYYKRNEYTKEKQKRKDNKDLSSKDQFNKATFNPYENQASRVKSHESTGGSGTV